MNSRTTPFDEESAEVRASRYRTINRELARILSECKDVDDAIPLILRTMGEGLGWDYGTYWKPDDDAQNLHCVATWIDGPLDLAEFDDDTWKRTFHVGEGVLGAAWEGGEPVWVTDIEHEPGFRRPEIASRAGLRSAIYIPIPTGHGGRRDALIEFLLGRTSQPDDLMIEMLHTVSSFVYQYLRLRDAEVHLFNLRGLDLNDNVVQGLVMAKMAIESGNLEMAKDSIDGALDEAKRIINELVAGASDFRRDA